MYTGIPFLGFRIYPSHRRLKRRRGIAFQHRLKRNYFLWLDRKIPRERLDGSVQSWVAYAAWGDTFGLRRKVLGKYILPSL